MSKYLISTCACECFKTADFQLFHVFKTTDKRRWSRTVMEWKTGYLIWSVTVPNIEIGLQAVKHKQIKFSSAAGYFPPLSHRRPASTRHGCVWNVPWSEKESKRQTDSQRERERAHMFPSYGPLSCITKDFSLNNLWHTFAMTQSACIALSVMIQKENMLLSMEDAVWHTHADAFVEITSSLLVDTKLTLLLYCILYPLKW